jgi:anti-sigma B factor antagonist
MGDLTETDGRISVLRPRGSLDGDAAASLKEEARERIEAGDDVVLDMAEVSFTDSEGLSVLVAIYKLAAARERRFALVRVRNNLRALLEITRLHRVFEVYPDVADARSAYAGTGGA